MKRRRPTEEELERDIADHIAMETEDNMARGMSPAEARYAALRKFGNITRVKEDTRSVWGWTALETWYADVRHALRRMQGPLRRGRLSTRCIWRQLRRRPLRGRPPRLTIRSFRGLPVS